MCLFSRDIHGYVLWCRKGHFSSPMPQAKPRRISLDIQGLSLDQTPAALPLRSRYRVSLKSNIEMTYNTF